MKQTFADSFYLLALFNPADAAHEQALAATKEIDGVLVTTDWNLTETADALCGLRNRVRCVQFINDLRGSASIEVIPASAELFNSGWKLFGDRPDKDWSLTDCISFVVMEERGIADALTGDHHFEQAGFRAIMK